MFRYGIICKLGLGKPHSLAGGAEVWAGRATGRVQLDPLGMEEERRRKNLTGFG